MPSSPMRVERRPGPRPDANSHIVETGVAISTPCDTWGNRGPLALPPSYTWGSGRVHAPPRLTSGKQEGAVTLPFKPAGP
jgi:hypothetical protein